MFSALHHGYVLFSNLIKGIKYVIKEENNELKLAVAVTFEKAECVQVLGLLSSQEDFHCDTFECTCSLDSHPSSWFCQLNDLASVPKCL